MNAHTPSCTNRFVSFVTVIQTYENVSTLLWRTVTTPLIKPLTDSLPVSFTPVTGPVFPLTLFFPKQLLVPSRILLLPISSTNTDRCTRWPSMPCALLKTVCVFSPTAQLRIASSPSVISFSLRVRSSPHLKTEQPPLVN